jgi:hypothetical protein
MLSLVEKIILVQVIKGALIRLCNRNNIV